MANDMPRALVLFAPGFEEIELVTVVDVLRRAEVEVTLAGTGEGLLLGSHGIGIQADRGAAGLSARDFDAVILPGGMPSSRTLAADPDCQRLLREAREADRVIGAICAAPVALAAAGVIGESRITSHPSVANELASTHYRSHRVVRDGRLITSRGPGTAMEFALALVAVLVDRERAESVAAPMLLPP